MDKVDTQIENFRREYQKTSSCVLSIDKGLICVLAI
jgi:hypothetical protein